MRKRISELDSLRGLAALTVLFGHILNTFPPLPKVLLYSPFRIFWAGHEAVILFFMLSGFVLTLPFLKTEKVNYGLYLVKRILRIYIPYVIAIFVSLSIMKVFKRGTQADIRWIQNFWQKEFSFSDLINHLLLISDFNTDAVDPVIWSLVHEMRISIIFPFVVLLVLKSRWYQSLLLAILLSTTGALISFSGLDVSQGYLTSYAHTIHYTAFFIVGSLLAINKEFIVEIFNKFSLKIQLLILVSGICIYSLQTGLGYFLRIETGLFFREWFIVVGAGLLIVVSISAKWASVFLSKKPIKFLGEISYSLYLYHLPILIATLYALHDFIPQPIIYIISLPVIFGVSTLSFKIVEKSSIRYGQALSKKWNKKKANTTKGIKGTVNH
ncbi:acyltransferase family protein [Rossellomorea vietnamensis]|uniref:Acyltransferase 3 domain-containing protein n=1 Tax=Rossellomorea vietnamensis TaxID=218284 RepID=A0A0N8GGS0_9BACI|nr:acyltransferase [Rossellomorea vietnamensis]KPL59274.1 hypothetical protein AM506_12180 [Rossellomorea vietnamensis]